MCFNLLYILLFTFSCSNDSVNIEREEEIERKENLITDNKQFTFSGEIDYIDTLNRKIIYRAPLDINDSGDYIEGALLMLDLTSLVVDTIADTMLMYYPNSFVKNDTVCIITTQSAVYEYFYLNGTTSYTEFYRVSEPEYIFDVSYNLEQDLCALLLFNENVNKFEIRILGSDKNVIYSGFYNVNYEDFGGYVFGDVHWINNRLIFSVEDKLYNYSLEENKVTLFKENLFYYFDKPLYSSLNDKLYVVNYALDSDSELYITEIDVSSNEALSVIEVSSFDIYDMRKSCLSGKNVLILSNRNGFISLDIKSKEMKMIDDTFYSCTNFKVTRTIENKSIWDKYTVFIE